MSSASITPVLIVGAGPSGLAAALTLVKNGINVRIIDKLREPHNAQRGAGIQPRTIEVYNMLGILPDVVAQGLSLRPMTQYKSPGGIEVASSFYMSPQEELTPSKPYINALTLGQARTEAIFRKHLADFGCRVEFGTELLSFEDHADHVTAHIKTVYGAEETLETVACHWLVGTDGGRGVVRRQLGLTFLGESRADKLVFGDIAVQGLDDEHWHAWGVFGQKYMTMRPTEDKGMFQFLIGGDVDHDRIFADDGALLQTMKEISNRTDLVYGEVKNKSDYTPKMRMVDRFSEGHVFVAGDAAHVHSPTGGQGLNSSVQDAFNLGWKLALVEKGAAAPSLLATYNEERHPVIAHMLETTTKLYRATFGATSGAKTGSQAWSHMQGMKQLGIHYRWSSIVVDERDPAGRAKQPEDVYGAHTKGGPRAGDRAPDAPGLVPIKTTNGPESESTSLFRIFVPNTHTVIIFSDSDELVAYVHNLVQSHPSGLLHSVLVRPQVSADAHDARVDLVVVDRDGHAYGGYGVTESGIKVAIVRPDGVIGGMLFGSAGVKRYLDGVFSATQV